MKKFLESNWLRGVQFYRNRVLKKKYTWQAPKQKTFFVVSFK